VYWLMFLACALLLYLPPLYLARQLWLWAEQQYWWLLLLGWRSPAWLAYIAWLIVLYALAGGLALAVAWRLPEDSGLVRLARQLSQASLGWPGALVTATAALMLLLAWPILPLLRATHGWQLALSTPTVALAALYLAAEALRLAEHNLWIDRAFEAWRHNWLVEQGYH